MQNQLCWEGIAEPQVLLEQVKNESVLLEPSLSSSSGLTNNEFHYLLYNSFNSRVKVCYSRLVEGTVLRTIFRGSKASEKCFGSHFPTSVMVTQQLTLQRLSDHEGYSGFLIHGWQHVPSHYKLLEMWAFRWASLLCQYWEDWIWTLRMLQFHAPFVWVTDLLFSVCLWESCRFQDSWIVHKVLRSMHVALEEDHSNSGRGGIPFISIFYSLM